MARSVYEPGEPKVTSAGKATCPLSERLFRLLMRAYRKVFARKRLYPLNKLLFNVSLRGMGILNNEQGDESATGEAYFLQMLTSRWGPQPVILDVGAHIGNYANRILSLAPSAILHAFEPHPRSFARLQQEAARSGYTAFNVGCGDEAGTVTLYDHHQDDGSHHATLYRDVIETLHRDLAVATRVEMIVLDKFLREKRIERVDLLKIDTEGHERQVLQGLQSALGAGIIDVIHFEFNAMNIVSRSFFKDFVDLLPGYSFHRMLPGGLVPLGEYRPVLFELYAYQNVVAVRNGMGVML
ncbi:MAG: FkbM family methyltransferase [Nitrospiraceae bacterium]